MNSKFNLLIFVIIFSSLCKIIEGRGECLLNKSVQFGCSDTLASIQSKGAACVSNGDATYCVGYRQVTSNNKDPIFVKFNGANQVACRTDWEVTGDDGSGFGIFYDSTSNRLWGFFSSTGTQGTPDQDFRRFCTNGWLKTYTDGSTSGGGAKVLIVLQIDPDTANPIRGTFVTARLSNGKVNSVADVSGAGITSQGDLVLGLNAAYSARNLDKSVKDCSCDGCSPYYDENKLWNWELTLDSNLNAALFSCASACTPNQCRNTDVNVDSCGSNNWDWNKQSNLQSSASMSSYNKILLALSAVIYVIVNL